MSNSAFNQSQTGNASEIGAGSVKLATQAQVDAKDADDGGVPLVVTPDKIPVVVFSGARVYKNANQTIGTGDNVAQTFQVESFDTDSYHDLVTNPERITIPTDGKYMVGCSLASTAADNYNVSIRVNGSLRIAGSRTAGGSSASCSALYEFIAGDYIEMIGDAGSSGDIAKGSDETSMWIQKVG